jgi:protein gp37
MTSIEWTDATWNPVVGCSRVSAGCVNCYAERLVHRGLAPQHRGLTVMRGGRPGWTGEVRLVADRITEPLSWRKPRRVFVNSLSDLFHESLPIADIARVFAVMAHTERHTFQVLTKRTKRMRQILASDLFWTDVDKAHIDLFSGDVGTDEDRDRVANACMEGVLPNVWLGTSVEDQETANDRIPYLIEVRAAHLFVSYEPALGAVDFDLPRCGTCGEVSDSVADDGATPWCSEHDEECSWGHWLDFDLGDDNPHRVERAANGGITWVIVGGESGPGARPFDLAWARSVIAQCREAGTKVFVKQLGADPRGNGFDVKPQRVNTDGSPAESGRVECRLQLRDRKGGDMNEWPADIRVREMPTREKSR